MLCHYFPETKYLIFAEGVPELLYYSHIPVLVAVLIVGIFVFLNQPKALLNRIFLVITLSFSAWTFINLIAWTNIHSQFLMLVWTFFGVFASLIAIFLHYFIHVNLQQKDVSLWHKVVYILLFAPVIIFATTDLNISGFNISDCDAFGFEGFAYNLYYNTILPTIIFIWIAFGFAVNYSKIKTARRSQIILLTVAAELFLLTFFALTYFGSYLANFGYNENSEVEFYGLFGMAIFIVLISVSIVKFKSFNVSTHAANALIIGLMLLVASQYTYANSTTTTIILTSVTLLLTTITGWFLAKSVRREVKQRKELEQLTKKLADANERLKQLDKLKSEFVSIASHQMRSPLTSIRGYASMLIDQSFGQIPEKAIDPLKRIEESARHMAMAIEDYLNVSRIESGNMKYNNSDFNLKDETEKICDDIRQIAMEKQLVLLFRTDLKSRGIVNADIGKTIQIIHNLVNNAMKYTPKGSITVYMRDDLSKKRIYVDIIDTGIGISKENIEKLFQKFSRANNANSVNVTGTGLGLFVARQMAVAMGGDITAKSEGDGKGSVFTLELPLMM